MRNRGRVSSGHASHNIAPAIDDAGCVFPPALALYSTSIATASLPLNVQDPLYNSVEELLRGRGAAGDAEALHAREIQRTDLFHRPRAERAAARDLA